METNPNFGLALEEFEKSLIKDYKGSSETLNPMLINLFIEATLPLIAHWCILCKGLP